MGEGVPTPQEILTLAGDIVECAAQRQAAVDLDFQPEDTANAQYFQLLRRRYRWIAEAFARALSYVPEPARLAPLIDLMKDCEQILTGGAELHLARLDRNGTDISMETGALTDPFWSRADGVRAKVAEWTGDAADNFRRNFLAYLSACPGNQAVAFRSLNLAMVAARNVYEQYLRDLHAVAATARDVLRPGFHAPDGMVLLGLAAGVSQFVAGVATLAEGGGFVALEGVMNVLKASGEAGRDGERHGIGGVTVDDVLDRTNDLVARTVAHLDLREQEIVGNITSNHDAFGVRRDLFVVPAPSPLVSLAGRPVEQWWNDFD